MIYSTGTISLNGNVATGNGSNWTDSAAQVRAGQTLIILSSPVQIFQISAVNSATQLTVTPAASLAVSGQKYGILVSDAMTVDGLAQSMSQLIQEYDENIGAWETFALTSAAQDITVTINGQQVTIPSVGKLKSDIGKKAAAGENNDITSLSGLKTALSVGQGGTGGKDAQTARNNLELGGDSAPTFSGLSLKTSTSASGILYQEFAIGTTKFRSRSYTERRSDGSNFWTWALANRNNTETYFSFRDDGQLMLSRCMNLGAPVATDWSTLLNNANAPGLFFEARQDNGGASALGSLNFSYLHSGGYKLTTALAMVGRGTSQWASTVMVQGGDGGSAATRYWVFDPVSGDLSNSGGGGWGG
uniref:hypothetical protein n=1 Tax=Franconibacter pulveris TaxID=435910 RepID=UPI000464E781